MRAISKRDIDGNGKGTIMLESVELSGTVRDFRPISGVVTFEFHANLCWRASLGEIKKQFETCVMFKAAGVLKMQAAGDNTIHLQLRVTRADYRVLAAKELYDIVGFFMASRNMTAFCMGTHERLGGRNDCYVRELNKDVLTIVYDLVQRDK